MDNISINTKHQNGNNSALIGNNNFVSIVKQKTYWYGIGTGILVSVIVNLLSNFIYDLIK